MYDYYDFTSGWLSTYMIIIVVISLGVAVGLAFIPAALARNKGYSYGAFWVFGFFLFLPALITVLCLQDKNAPAYYPPQQPYQNYQPPYQGGYQQPPYQPGYQQPPYQPPYQQPPVQPAVNLQEELQKLWNMKEQGQLTEEEFEAAKKKLLG